MMLLSIKSSAANRIFLYV